MTSHQAAAASGTASYDVPFASLAHSLVPHSRTSLAVWVPDRVGVVLFHHLTGCRVDWNLGQRIWCIDCP
jgi:hypothetical protein